MDMKFLLFNLLLCAIGSSISDAYCNKDTKNIDLKLKNDLLCHYDADARPTLDNTPISMKYVLRSFDFEDVKELLTIRSNILQRWNDSRLSWEPEKYEGIKTVYVSSEYIWTPQLFLNDSHYNYGIGSCQPSQCLIRNDYQVACIFPCHQKARCKGNFAEWPFDIQTCSVVFKTFLTKEDASFDYDQFSGTLLSENSNQFRILSSKAQISSKDKTFVKFVFVLERISDSIFQNVLIPGYVLIGLTLTILFMQHGSMIRSIFSGVSIFLHFSLMDRVWWQVPSNGSEVPRITKYMTMMLLFTSIVFLETITLKIIAQPTRKIPAWLQSFMNFLENSKIFKYFIASPFDEEAKIKPIQPLVQAIEETPEETTENTISPKNQLEPTEATLKNDWTTFCRIVDRTFFVALSVGYSIYNGY